MVRHSKNSHSVSGICDNATIFEDIRNFYNVHDSHSQVKPPSLPSFRQTRNSILTDFRTLCPQKEDTLSWDEHTQNLVLGAFFWLAWFAQFLGGMLSHRYGSKLVFGLSNFVACLLSATIPPLAYVDAKLVIGVRVAQGFIGVN